ncbi:hypothetical protein [uncultured Tateyamaria sp.]|uniref:hypothetical protein n=1 Tax=uncultured Tateyamaria sp. TaxID=455651 RepID=UPI0026079B61|nr:hypothetical protein [uncultured Tateyamaria sp.]
MDATFAQAVSKIIEMPVGTQRIIGEALLDGGAQPDLPVIEFTAEESAKIDEALEDIETGNVIGQEEMTVFFERLRAKGYAQG